MYLVLKKQISTMNIKEFFKQFRIFDGGMGQELLARGIKPISNLWSATALLKEEYHQTVIDTHIDFINAGAEVILTNTFGARLRRCEDTKIVDKFEYLNQTAVNLAKKAVDKTGKKILIGASLPPQNFTYMSDLGPDKNKIFENFKKQADLINEGTDFFYLDVMCSLEEAEIGINSIKHLNKEFIVGLHYKKDGKLPSGEYFIDVLKALKKYKPLAVTGSCVSVEDTLSMKKDLNDIDIPFGFKINAFKEIPFGWKPDATNPNEVLGKDTDITTEKFLDISQQLIDLGSKIIGGCCEITPSHISKLKKLKC